MKFILDHDIQRKTKPGLPLEIIVEPERRTGEYPVGCPCQWVFRIHADSMHALKEMGMVLDENKSTCVCLCMGRLHAEAAGELLAVTARPAPVMPKLTRPLCVIDLETTDAEPATCAIFQFGVCVLHPDGRTSRWSQSFKPWKPISPRAEEITGTTNAMVENCPPFSEFAVKIASGLKGKDLAGYNIKSFDAVALDEELRRCNLKLDLDGVTVVDVFHLFQRKEPRDLTAAVRRYCGRSHEGAHGAAADSEATADVLCGQLGAYPDLAEMNLEDLDKFSLRDPERRMADIAGKLYFDADGDLRYTMAKVRDVKVKEDAGFAYWMKKQSNPPFPGSTLEVLDAELRKHGLL